MALNSVNTNVNASIALSSLEMTNAQLASVQKQVSTGFRVADAVDDGAAYAVAQRVRSDVNALTSANQQLGNVQGLLSTTVNGLTAVSNIMSSARDVLVKLADSNTQGTQRSQYIQQYQSLVAQMKSDFQDSAYNGKTLIGDMSGSAGTFGSVGVVRNEVGATYSIGTYSGSAFMGSVTFTSTQLSAATTVGALITATATPGQFINKLNQLGTELNSYGAATNYVTNQQTFNTSKITSLNNGLGALVDANLAQESAQLQALQIRQQLGTQALSIANQSPQSLLSLFK